MRRARRGRGGHGHRQTTGRPCHGRPERLFDGRHRIGIAGSWTGGDIQQSRAVAHGPAENMLGAQPVPGFAVVGSGRGASPGGFDAEHPTTPRRDPDRAPSVAAVSGGHHPRGHRRRRAAAGSPAAVISVPGVAGGTKQPGFGGGRPSKLGSVGLAGDHQSRRPIAAYQFAVMGGHLVHEEGAAGHGGNPCIGRPQVLEQERHPGEGTIGQATFNGSPGLVVHLAVDGVQHRVQPFNPLNGSVEQFGGSRLLAPHQLGQSYRVVILVLQPGAPFDLSGPKLDGTEGILAAIGYSMSLVVARFPSFVLASQPPTR